MFEHWFTETCTALVDDHGHALTGALLEAAKKDPQAKRCGHRVKRKAKFCSKCGSPTPMGWWRCAGCGRWIGNESAFCPHCSKAQAIDDRLTMKDGVWQKAPSLFAQRFEASDITALMQRGLTIREGERALVLNDGAFAEVLQPGLQSREVVEGMRAFLAAGGRKQLVMVDASAIEFPLQVEVETSEALLADVRCVAVVQLDEAQPVPFLANLLGADPSLTYEAIAERLLPEVKLAVQAVCRTQTVDTLFKDPNVRIDLEDGVATALTRHLAGLGLRFVRLGEVEFTGALFEHLRREAGAVEQQRRELEFQLRVQAMMRVAKVDSATGEAELEAKLATLAHEKQVRETVHQEELNRLREAATLAQLKATQEVERSQQAHADELERMKSVAAIERRQQEHAEVLRQRLAEQQHLLDTTRIQVEIDKLKAMTKIEITKAWLEVQIAKQSAQQKLQHEQVNMLDGKSALAILASISDPVLRRQMLEAIQFLSKTSK